MVAGELVGGQRPGDLKHLIATSMEFHGWQFDQRKSRNPCVADHVMVSMQRTGESAETEPSPVPDSDDCSCNDAALSYCQS